jgi:hypothetical protein
MKYTIIYTDTDGNYRIKLCVASHDKNIAWTEAQQLLKQDEKLQLLSPGEQIIYSERDIKN